MKELLDGEVICVNVTPNVKAFYFDKTRETETLNNRKENKNNE
jgi:hypothetical protein